jgi:DNA-binding CsgD family transcriptional regulator
VPFGFTDRSDLGLAAGGAVGAGAAGDGERERLVAGFGQGGQALDGELAFGQGHGRRTLETAADDALLAPDITRRLIEQFVRRPPPGSAIPPALGALTSREVDVLRLIARGLSNAEIAAELVVAETTVRTHVTRILAKLGARDRVQAVVAAYESGLVQPGSA